jgi:hypothetical protein
VVYGWDSEGCFLELYRIARVPAAFVGDNFQYQGGSIHWDVTFSRLAQD